MTTGRMGRRMPPGSAPRPFAERRARAEPQARVPELHGATSNANVAQPPPAATSGKGVRMKDFEALLRLVAKHPVRRVAVAVAQDPSVIQAVEEARKRDIAEAVLVGDEGEIAEAAESVGVSLDEFRVMHEADPLAAVERAVSMVSSGGIGGTPVWKNLITSTMRGA